MNGTNGYSHQSSWNRILAFIDSCLILIGIFMGGVFRFWAEDFSIFQFQYTFWKITVFISVIQIVFYYFNLYELWTLRARVKMLIRVSGSLGISFFLLAVVYYVIPDLAIGRGILFISLLVIFLLIFLCRLAFGSICRNLIKERILIVGTGELAKGIAKEINENRQDICEIIGFVAE